VLEYSAELARAEHAELVVLYAMPVATPINAVAFSGGAYLVSPMGDDQANFELSACFLHQVVAATGFANADCLCERGSPVDRIRDAAERINADLIVVGTHRNGRLFHAMFGSVREALFTESPCPVLVVPTSAKPS